MPTPISQASEYPAQDVQAHEGQPETPVWVWVYAVVLMAAFIGAVLVTIAATPLVRFVE